MWKKALNAIPNSEEFKGWYETFTFDGKTPEPGQMICMPKLADALERLPTQIQMLYTMENWQVALMRNQENLVDFCVRKI